MPPKSKVNLEGKTVLGDKAFCSVHIRDFIQTQGGAVCIPNKVNVKVKHELDRELYKARNVVERLDKESSTHSHSLLAVCFLKFVIISALLIQL